MKKHLSLLLLTGFLTISLHGGKKECCAYFTSMWEVIKKAYNTEDDSEGPYCHPTTKNEFLNASKNHPEKEKIQIYEQLFRYREKSNKKNQ